MMSMTTTLDTRTLIEGSITFAASDFTDPRLFELMDARLSSGA